MAVDRFGFVDDTYDGDEDAELLANPDLRPRDQYPHMYCRHGTYIGGLGADLMCGKCESGWDDEAEKHEVTVEISFTETVEARSLEFAQDEVWSRMIDRAVAADSDAFTFKVTADFALFREE